MILSPPQRGTVIRYSYLWAHEQAAGRDDGRKDRPALVLALSVKVERSETECLVLAITHSPPENASSGLSLPAAVKRELRLDEADSWIFTTEANAFVWPGPDLRRVPDREPATVIYGRVPHRILVAAARSYLSNRARQRSSIVMRLP